MNAKLFAVAALVVALAATGAGWKWAARGHGHASGSFRIAGWTWASMEGDNSDDQGTGSAPTADSISTTVDSQQDVQ